MKRYLFILLSVAVMLLNTKSSYSQPWEVGGNSSTGGGYIGTTDSVDFPIRTNGFEKMIVKVNGDIGIGISSPTARLHTKTTATPTANYTGNLLENLATSSTSSITKTGLNIQSTGNWTGDDAVNIGLHVNVSGATGTGGKNYSALFSGGFVGVGTISPTFRLSVIDTTSLFFDARFSRTTNTAG